MAWHNLDFWTSFFGMMVDWYKCVPVKRPGSHTHTIWPKATWYHAWLILMNEWCCEIRLCLKPFWQWSESVYCNLPSNQSIQSTLLEVLRMYGHFLTLHQCDSASSNCSLIFNLPSDIIHVLCLWSLNLELYLTTKKFIHSWKQASQAGWSWTQAIL